MMVAKLKRRMKGNEKMKANKNQKVYSANGRLQAIWVESILVQAGVPVSFCESRTGAYLDVFVPKEHVFDAKNILNPEHESKEMCSNLASL
jgi:hypothetical protein